MARIKDDEREFRQAMAHEPGADPRPIAARLGILPGRLACLLKRLARVRPAPPIRAGRAWVEIREREPEAIPFPGIGRDPDEPTELE